MSGKVMTGWLGTTYPDLKILFTSGYTDNAISRYSALEEEVKLLPKPCPEERCSAKSAPCSITKLTPP
jgi:hypothetical protein